MKNKFDFFLWLLCAAVFWFCVPAQAHRDVDPTLVYVTAIAPEPTAQPTNLTFRVGCNAIYLNFSAAVGPPEGYLVIRCIGEAPNTDPTDGVEYHNGDPIGNGGVVYVGNSLSISHASVITETSDVSYYKIYSYNGAGTEINYLTTDPLAGSQQVANEYCSFYSRTNGDWQNPDSWSNISHTGPPSDSPPFSTGNDVVIGNGNTIKLTENVSLPENAFRIEQGATLDANDFSIEVFGPFSIGGSILHGGELKSSFADLRIYSYSEIPVFKQLTIDNVLYIDGVRLFTDIVLLNGVKIINGNGKLRANGFTIYPCVPPTTPAGLAIVTARSGDHATVEWPTGSGDRTLVVGRVKGTNALQPKPGIAYTANSVFGSGSEIGAGNFVVYSGVAASVEVTGLSHSLDYQFEAFTFSSSGNCYNVSAFPRTEVTNPADGAIDVSVNPRVTARLIVGAWGFAPVPYSIELSPMSDFSSGVVTMSGESNNVNFTGLLYSTRYYTRVKTPLSYKYSKVTSFTTGAPHLFTYMVTPKDLSTGQSTSPTIVSSLVSGSPMYTIELNTKSDFTGTSIVQSGARSLKFNNLTLATTYYVRIKTNLDNEWGSTRSFKTKDGTALSYITNPADGAINVMPNTNLISNLVPGAALYTIEANTSADFTGTAIVNSSPSRTIPFNLQFDTPYYVRVTTDLNEGHWGDTRSFTTGSSVSLAYLVYPSNGAVGVPLTVNVNANSLPGATSYTIELNTSQFFNGTSLVGTSATRTVKFVGLADATTYYARVSTNLAPGQWGPTRSFATGSPSARIAGGLQLEEQPSEANDISIYPVPFTDRISILVHAQKDERLEVSLLDIFGEQKAAKGGLTNHELELEGDDLPAGFYFVKIRTVGSTVVQKVLKPK